MNRATTCGLLICLMACGGDRENVPVLPRPDDGGDEPNPDAGKKPDAGKSDAGKPDSGADDPLAPKVSFDSLTVANDPNQDTVITDASFSVRCKVTASGSSPVDKAMVKIVLIRSDDTTKTLSPAVSAQPNDIYEAMFDLSGVPNGAITFRCEGRDMAATPHVATTSLKTLLDLGPEIEFFEPKDKDIHAIKTPVTINFQIKPAPLTDDDEEADVKEVKLKVGDLETPVEESEMTPGLYQTSIDFNDRDKYPVPPTSAQIEVTATNARTPQAAKRTKKIEVTIDGEGPTIKVDDPPDGKIVKGTVTLKVTVSDPAGLMQGSLVANINNGLYVIDKWKGTGPSFEASFDTRDPNWSGTSLTQLTINVTAVDAVANKATASLQLKLDNLPPVISLDPPNIREYKPNSTICSNAFDPLGPEAANDLGTVRVSSRFRALVEDDTNRSSPTAVAYLAGVATSTVELYVQPDNRVPILTATAKDKDAGNNPDHRCVEINQPADKLPTKIQLKSVNPGGSAWYTNNLAGNPAAPGWCTQDTMMNAPLSLCPMFSDMFRVVPGRVQGKPPAVYAYRASNDSSSGECNGEVWELLSIIKKDDHAYEGWVCMAARVEDNIGNIGVSAPLRICFDDGNDANGTPTCDMGQLPDCTGGCTVPPAYKFVAGDVWLQQ